MRSARASASRRRPKGTGRSMRLEGVSYGVGRVLGMNWRLVFDRDVVHRELAIIKTDPEPWRHDRRQRNHVGTRLAHNAALHQKPLTPDLASREPGAVYQC
jgi:hypothetical protein